MNYTARLVPGSVGNYSLTIFLHYYGLLDLFRKALKKEGSQIWKDTAYETVTSHFGIWTTNSIRSALNSVALLTVNEIDELLPVRKSENGKDKDKFLTKLEAVLKEYERFLKMHEPIKEEHDDRTEH
jgi:hypothetical protein